MAKKERIEDLGRLSILLKNIFYEDVYIPWENPEHSYKVFCMLNDKTQEDILLSIASYLENLRTKIGECINIADGED